MEVSVTDAKAQLTDLVRRAEAGEEIVLTRHGKAAIRFQPIKAPQSPEQRRAILNAISRAGAAKATPGPDAARSQDFLYDEHGLPV